MRQYKLVYLQPYERDNDSPSGIGDHSIQYARRETTYEAQTDKEAVVEAGRFLKYGSIIFGPVHGDGKEYMRKPVELSVMHVVRKWSQQ